MPVTIAHPVAAIPLRRPLGRMGVLSALVIGSLTPDIPIYLPLSLHRNVAHSLAGLFWFCLPVGVGVYLLFDRVLERPLRALMPEAIQARLPRAAPRPPGWSVAVVVSIMVGAATHTAWDSFTHGGAFGVRLFPALETRLFTVSGYTAYVFSVLQHASSLVGTVLMTVLIVRWFRAAPRADGPAPEGLTPRARRWLLAAIAAFVLAAVVTGGVSRFPDEPTLRSLQSFVRGLIVMALSSLFAAITVYAVIWHWLQFRDSRAA